MARFLVERVLLGLLTIFAVATVVFFSSRLTGDPAILLIPQDATPEVAAQIRRQHGLDQPVLVQYGHFLVNAVQGDFGRSYRTGYPAIELVKERAPASLRLAVVSFVLGLSVAFPLGVSAALHKDRWIDGAARGVAFMGLATPSFFIGIVLISVVATRVQWLPAGGDQGVASYILPAITMSAFLVGSILRLVRSGMIEALDAEYVRMARLKGLPEHTVVWKHALRNALLPVLAFTGMYFALFVTVAIVVEVVFAWPGMGRLAFEAVLNRDLAVLQAVVISASALTIFINLLVDLLSAAIDPRIRLRRGMAS